MKTTVEKEGPTKLKLLIEVEPTELEPLYDQTFKRLAGEVNVPGFRKGKVPRAVIESRLGRETIRSEFLRDALPSLYAAAAREEDVNAITLPDIEVTQFGDGTPLTFTAIVEIRPEISLPEYTNIPVEKPDPTPLQAQIDEQVERLRDRFGTLEPIGRTATGGDYVTIDITGTRHGEKLDNASATDLLYAVGSGSVVAELDQELEGKRAGDILKFNAKLPETFATMPGEEITFTVLVKDVQAKKLPDLDDEFAKTASEFDTLQELRDDVGKRLRAANEIEAEIEVRNRILEDLVQRTDVPVPEAMISSEVQHRLSHLLQDLQRAGVTLDQYLKVNDSTEEQLIESLRKAAERTIAADLLLEAVAKSEGIKVEGAEVDQEIEQMANRVGVDPSDLRRQLIESERVLQLAGDILRRKALNFLVEKANVTGGDPQAASEEEVAGPNEKE